MMKKNKTIRYVLYGTTLLCLCGCAIKDDIPYPIVDSAITAFEVEGQCDATGTGMAAAEIDNASRTVKAYVNDMVNPAALKITRMEVSNDAEILTGGVTCVDASAFPKKGFASAPATANTRVDFTQDAIFTLKTYQEYDWTVTVEQIIHRDVEVEGQVGNAVVDAGNRVAIIYVSDKKGLRALKVTKFNLGGEHGKVVPDPTARPTYDFSDECIFYVQESWSELSYEWKVYVFPTEASVEPTVTVSANDKGATIISGMRPNGVTPVVEYREESTSVWTTVAQGDVRYPSSTSYEVVLSVLRSDVKYLCRVTFGGKTIEGEPFYFQGEQLKNASFNDWHIEGEGTKALYCPWAEGGDAYWDTGNHGATTVGASNSTYVDEDGRRYANLQSKYIVIKFAAGNIFTGKYIETDGTNGVLSFGRPFSSRPAKMQFDFQYKTAPVTRTGGDWKEPWGQYIPREMYEGMKGQPDSCSVYIALGDWEPVTYTSRGVIYTCPYLIRTRPSALSLMDMHSPNLIGYGQMTCGEDVSSWTTQTIDIHYYNDRIPTTIIVVAASSKYGDYFTGGEGSQLKVDDFKLIYE